MPMQNYTQYYAYDEAGNITELRHQAAAGSYTRDYQYSSTNNQLQSSYGSMYTYTHDPDQGYITPMPHLPLMDWNYKDELVAVSRQQGANPEITYYQYDSQGRRLRKVTEYQGSGPPPGQKDQRIYLEGYEYYENFNSGEQIHSLSLKDERQRFVMVEKTNIPGHHLLVRYLHDSHQGSCTLETDESGNVITYEEYHPFGTSSYQATNAGILSSSKRYRYVGKERDEESGLYYYGARFYAPWLCRFMSCDPKAAQFPDQSPYNYCNNNPINLIDPDGQSATPPDKILHDDNGGEDRYVEDLNGKDYITEEYGHYTNDEKTGFISRMTVTPEDKQWVAEMAQRVTERNAPTAWQKSMYRSMDQFQKGFAIAAIALPALPVVAAEGALIAGYSGTALKATFAGGGAYSLLSVGKGYVGSTIMRASVETMAQTAVNKGDITKLDVADIGFTALTPFGSALFGGAADWKPFDPDNSQLKSILGTGDNSKSFNAAMTDFGIKLTFGGAGLLKPFNKVVNTLGTPQLNSIFSTPFSFGGKTIGNQIKVNLQNVDTTKTR
jgi:RHS repeat-associated protein